MYRNFNGLKNKIFLSEDILYFICRKKALILGAFLVVTTVNRKLIEYKA